MLGAAGLAAARVAGAASGPALLAFALGGRLLVDRRARRAYLEYRASS